MAFIQILAILSLLQQLQISHQTNTKILFSDVSNFCFKNGINYLSISNYPHFRNSNEILKMAHMAQRYNLSLRMLKFDQISSNYIFYQDSLLLLAKSDQLYDEKEFHSELKSDKCAISLFVSKA